MNALLNLNKTPNRRFLLTSKGARVIIKPKSLEEENAFLVNFQDKIFL